MKNIIIRKNLRIIRNLRWKWRLAESSLWGDTTQICPFEEFLFPIDSTGNDSLPSKSWICHSLTVSAEIKGLLLTEPMTFKRTSPLHLCHKHQGKALVILERLTCRIPTGTRGRSLRNTASEQREQNFVTAGYQSSAGFNHTSRWLHSLHIKWRRCLQEILKRA